MHFRMQVSSENMQYKVTVLRKLITQFWDTRKSNINRFVIPNINLL